MAVSEQLSNSSHIHLSSLIYFFQLSQKFDFPHMLTTLWVPYQQASLLLPPWHDSSCKTVVRELNKDPNFRSWKRHGILLSGGSKYAQLRILSWQGVSVLDSWKFLECDNPWNARRRMIPRTQILDRWSTLIDGTPKALVSTSPASSPLPTAHLQTHAPPTHTTTPRINPNTTRHSAI